MIIYLFSNDQIRVQKTQNKITGCKHIQWEQYACEQLKSMFEI